MSCCGSDGGSRVSASCTSTAPWESYSLSFWGKNGIIELLILLRQEGLFLQRAIGNAM